MPRLQVADAHAELIKPDETSLVRSSGTPDGILMSDISSVLSDFRSDALMPSKCTLATFPAATRPFLANLPFSSERTRADGAGSQLLRGRERCSQHGNWALSNSLWKSNSSCFFFLFALFSWRECDSDLFEDMQRRGRVLNLCSVLEALNWFWGKYSRSSINRFSIICDF